MASDTKTTLAIEVMGILPTQEILAPVHLIRDPKGARPVDMAHAANLAVSIDDVGLDHPISLRVLREDELGEDGCIWMRTRGGHRLAAFRLRGREAIPAKVRSELDEVAAMAEADENLIRRDLTPLERAQAFAERLSAWSAIHPDLVKPTDAGLRAKRGPLPKRDKLSLMTNGAPAMMGFAEETASVAGISKKTVVRALSIYRAVPASQQERLHGTWIANNDAALRQLAGIGDAAEQVAVIDVLLTGKTKNIAEARAIAAGTPIPTKAPSNTAQRDFEKVWKAASASERDAVLHWLSGQPLPPRWDIQRSGSHG